MVNAIFFLVSAVFLIVWWKAWIGYLMWDWVVSVANSNKTVYESVKKKWSNTTIKKADIVDSNKTLYESGKKKLSNPIITKTFAASSNKSNRKKPTTQSGTTTQSGVIQIINRSVIDNFDIDKIYEEVWEVSRNFSERWWVNSWAFFNVKNWVWSTVQWPLATWSKRQLKFAAHNWWIDTDWWYYPQNLFRLILNEKYQDYIQSAYYKINKYNLSSSPNRYESNWFFLFNRYLDQNNLYYTWIRVDWKVIIKKKYQWQYTTLAYKKIFDWVYNRDTNPNLIPTGKRIWVKSEFKNLTTGGVSINVYTDINSDWIWELALSFVDNTSSSISAWWYAWIRTDFMDVEIDRYNIAENKEGYIIQ